MSNKPNFPGSNYRGAPPPIKPVQVDVNTLDSFHCPNTVEGKPCLNLAFTPVYQIREIPALLANTPNGQPGTLKIEMMLCVRCGGVYQRDQLKRLTYKERESIRAMREIQFQMKEGDHGPQ